MGRVQFYLPKFDRDAEFVVAKAIRINGDDLRLGSPFDKSLVSIRTLRTMYDARQISVAPASAGAASPISESRRRGRPPKVAAVA